MKDGSITKQYVFSSDGSYPKIDIKGQLPISGIAYVDGECNVALSVSNEKYVIEKNSNTDEYTTKEDAQVNMQIKKFNYDGVTELHLLSMPAETPTAEGKQDLVDLYGQELADLLALMTSFQTHAVYVGSNDDILYWHYGFGFPKDTPMEKINRFRTLIKENENIKELFFAPVDDYLIVTATDIFVIVDDYKDQCPECFIGTASDAIAQLKIGLERYNGTETIVK